LMISAVGMIGSSVKGGRAANKEAARPWFA
jgi:hypothetical protein